MNQFQRPYRQDSNWMVRAASAMRSQVQAARLMAVRGQGLEARILSICEVRAMDWNELNAAVSALNNARATA